MTSQLRTDLAVNASRKHQSPKPTANLRAGLIGAGAIGRHHARVLSNLVGVNFIGLVDINEATAKDVCLQASVNYFHNLDELVESCDALVIATPTVTHFDLVSKALAKRKSVLVEKPLANSVGRARQLVKLAKDSGCHCVVGHVERFNAVVRWFRSNLNPREILSINITRVGPRPPRINDVGIIVDLAVHDIDLISHLCESAIQDIKAVCSSTNGGHEDVAQISIKTKSGAVCGINTNWLTPYKSRKIEIATSDAFYVGDLVGGSITKYQSVDPSGQRYVVETHTPKGLEPLIEQAIAFFNLVRGAEDSCNATVEEACETIRLAAKCLDGDTIQRSDGELH